MFNLSFGIKDDDEKSLSHDEVVLDPEAPENGIASVTTSAADERRLSRVRLCNFSCVAYNTYTANLKRTILKAYNDLFSLLIWSNLDNAQILNQNVNTQPTRNDC